MGSRLVAAVLTTAALTFCVPRAPALASHGATTRVSTSASGGGGNGYSRWASVSGDGYHVAFSSAATNIVSGDSNGVTDVFVKNLATGQIMRVSVASDGGQANAGSARTAISGDGRLVAFASVASNLVEGDANGLEDVFVHDRQTGQTVRGSVSDDGEEGGQPSTYPSISADGRYVAFETTGPLVPQDANGTSDVYVRDLIAGRTILVSVADDGGLSQVYAAHPSISADGSRVAFEAWDDSLAPGGQPRSTASVYVRDLSIGRTFKASIMAPDAPVWDVPGYSIFPAISPDGRYVAFSSTERLLPQPLGPFQMYLTDMTTGRVELASLSYDGQPGNGQTLEGAAVSADGRFVAFYGDATNLVPGDTNQTRDVFVRDRQSRTTYRASVSTGGMQSLLGSEFPSISWDGRLVAFESAGNTLTPGDLNAVSDVFVHDRSAPAPCGSGVWPEGPASGTVFTVADPSTPAGQALSSRACLMAEEGF